MKWLKFTTSKDEKDNKDKIFIPHGDDTNLIEGMKIVSIEVREDHQDLRIMLDGGELRIFGSGMLPSFLLLPNVKLNRL